MDLRNKELQSALDAFTDAMEERLVEKEIEGYGGWDDASMITNPDLVDRIQDCVDIVNDSPKVCLKEAVDAANLLMMLWYRAKSTFPEEP